MSPQATPTQRHYRIQCRMQQEAAALERLCQVVRIRGFRIQQMAVTSSDNQLDIALTLEGSRPVAMLKAQLEKLNTVLETALDGPAIASQTA
jgi:acetolactate synthase II small subunit